jgi:hypothetical protein
MPGKEAKMQPELLFLLKDKRPLFLLKKGISDK